MSYPYPPSPPPWPGPYGAGSPYMQTPGGKLAEWGSRLGGRLLDSVIVSALTGAAYFIGSPLLAALLATTGVRSGTAVLTIVFGWIGVMVIAVTAVAVWNTSYRRGKTGRTLGQQAVKIRTVDERTGEVIGFGWAFVRELCHIVDGLPCGIGYLAPLWDEKNQTWADKIMGTVVVEQPLQQLPPQPGVGHGPPTYGQNPYGQNPYGQNPYGQNPYGGHTPRGW